MSHARAIARIDLAAIESNCARLRSELAEEVQLCAVVKADGYGHGAIPCAQAALAGGARWLAVASLSEALELEPTSPARLLIMGPLAPEETDIAIGHGFDVVVWREQFLALVRERSAKVGKRARIHVKLDSGMGRLGTRDPQEASRIAASAAADPDVELVGAMTHFATADERGDAFFQEQLERFERWIEPIKQAHPDVIAHAANSAATLRDRRAHFDMVRCGIAIYGMDPFGEDPLAQDLEPALELCSYVADVKLCAAGESTGYGRRFIATADTHLAVLPIGYGDGWRRALSNNADVLIQGRRYPLVGTVSMDSVAVDLGADPAATELRGAEAVLIGSRGTQRITAEEIARRLHSINYEVTCGLTARVQRVAHGLQSSLREVERSSS